MIVARGDCCGVIVSGVNVRGVNVVEPRGSHAGGDTGRVWTPFGYMGPGSVVNGWGDLPAGHNSMYGVCQKLQTGWGGVEVGLGVSVRSHRRGDRWRERVSYSDERARKIGLVGRFELNKGSVIN